MDMSEYVAGLNRELASITRLASDEVSRAAEMITDAMESSVRLTLLEVLSAAADEITTQLDDVAIQVRLAGSDADFVVTATADEPGPAPEPDADGRDGADMSRVTLRLPESLKTRAETAAAAAGVSVNTWLVRAVSQALDGPPGGRGGPGGRSRSVVGQRYTGYARG
jgi:predicted HicB family RNase H-like nuclease